MVLKITFECEQKEIKLLKVIVLISGINRSKHNEVNERISTKEELIAPATNHKSMSIKYT